jgi:diguanylate cyclase (GGDEF)-like protein
MFSQAEVLENQTGEQLAMSIEPRDFMRRDPKTQFKFRNKRTIAVSTIAVKGICLEESGQTGNAVSLFERDQELQVIVVTRQEKPLGLIVRNKLNAKLGTRFGYDVYMKRPVTLVMDADPLILDRGTPVEIASKIAMSRQRDKIYDDMILTDNGIFYGVVPVYSLLSIITERQLELARAANPLTNLPGNPVIQNEITDRLETGERFAAVYCDLDNFKAYNDHYGFERGDRVLLLVAKILQIAVDKLETGETFLGHIGGDDFLIVAEPERAEQLCQDIITMFDSEIPLLYQEEDRRRGSICVPDRLGASQQYPLMSISLAIVANDKGCFSNCLEVAEVAAEVKKYVKSKAGSNYGWQRRHTSSREVEQSAQR